MTKGRPHKYAAIINTLEDETLYSPASMAQFAKDAGLLDQEGPDYVPYQRLRVTMGRNANNHHFPDEGDGLITLPGQSPCPGWFGWRWKSMLQPARQQKQTNHEP